MDYGYGNWLLVIISIILFLYFVKAAFRPRTKTDWKTYGIFGAFITALFAEMYGFPLTIYLLTSFFGSKFAGFDFSHQGGHLLNAILGIKGDPHFSIVHILSDVLIVGGLVLLGSAWDVLYKSSKKRILAITGAYQYIRHPQYLAFILVVIGFLLQWPTLITLIMAPILIARYIFLARKEEQEMLDKFGPTYENYRNKVPGFFPFLMAKSKLAIFLRGSLVGILGLSLFYYLILFVVTQDLKHPIDQFLLLQPWIGVLIVGFGIQAGLFWLLKRGYYLGFQEKHDVRLAAGSGTAVSGITMVACCAHHLVEILPILGFSAAALFLSEYQEQLLLLGVLTNFVGIIMMLWFIAGKARLKKSLVILLIFLVIGGIGIIGLSTKLKTSGDIIRAVTPQTGSIGAVEVEVTPQRLVKGREAVFRISLNTHSVDLNYDYKRVISLTDNLGRSYKALDWSGGNGGHHLSGQLIFEPLRTYVKTATVKIDGIDKESVSFTWNL